MTVSIRIPTMLRNLTGGCGLIDVDGSTVGEILRAADETHSGLYAKVADEEGGLRRYMTIYVGENDVRFMDGIDTAVAAGDTVSIVPAVAGG